MLIGIEAERANNPKKTGVEHYAKQLILHLAKIDNQNHYRLYLRSQPEEWFFSLPENFEIKVIPFPKFWTQLRLSWELFWHPVDRLFVPASALPFFHPKKSVCTIHDAAFLYYPEADTWFMRNYLFYSYKFIAKFAWKIIAISEATRQDLIKHFHVDSQKIHVVHHGYDVSQGFNSANTEEIHTDLLARLPAKFILFVSTLQPRKNLSGLITAFRIFKTQHPDMPHKLVVVGKPGWKYHPILEDIKANSDIVVYLGHVSDAEKAICFKRADAFVSASFYEGFGMWLLEAFTAGVPVAVSNNSSLPEIAGDAAMYFNADSTQEIAQSISNILTNESLRQTLISRGHQRLLNFSWEKSVRLTLEVLSE